MSNPDQLHLIAVGGVPLQPGDSPLLHTYRNDQGKWQGFLGNVNQQCGNSPQYFPVMACTGVGASLHVCGVDGQNKNIYHSIRYPGGGWQGFYGDVSGQNFGAPASGFGGVGCAGVESSGLLHLCAVPSNPDGRGNLLGGSIYHTLRRSDGTWQGFYGDVNGQNGGSGTPAFIGVACCTTPDETLHVFGTDSTNTIWYTYRRTDGSWQGSFTNVTSQVSIPINDTPGLACTAIDTTLHLCAITAGYIYHTSLPTGGTWQSPPDQPPPPPEGRTAGGWVGCANVDGTLHVVTLLSTSYDIFHITRDDSGPWSTHYEDVSQANNFSGPLMAFAIAGVSAS